MRKYIELLLQYLDNRYLAWLLAIILGALTFFCYAPYNLFWLMPIIMVLLIILLDYHQPRAVFLAYLWGVAAYTAQNYWINSPLHDTAQLPQLYAIPLTVLFPACLALYPAACFWLLRKFHFSKTIKIVFILPLLWTATEFLRETLFTGFGWGALGYSQIAVSPLAYYAPIGGISLVTFSVIFISACLAMAIISRIWWRKIAMLGCVIVVILLGSFLEKQAFTKPDGTSAVVALVQANISKEERFSYDTVPLVIQKYYDHVASLQDADIIILPEGSIPVLRQMLPEGVLAQFTSAAKRNHADLALGIFQNVPDGDGYQNVVINLADFDPNKPDDLPYYAKSHLVPFGEFRPVPLLTNFLYEMMNIPYSSQTPGKSNQLPLKMANQQLAFNICYEDSFGSELISTAKQSSLLVNVSNMDWFGNSNAMDLQLQHSQTRALELGRYMVRATNNGMTAVITPKGEIQSMIPRDIEQVLVDTVYGYQGETPYMKTRGYLPYLYLILLFVAYLVSRFKPRNSYY